MKFVLNRTKTIASVLGHSIAFEKGVPTYVPPPMYDEVMAAGASPEDEIDVPEDTKTQVLTPEDRKVIETTHSKMVEAEQAFAKHDEQGSNTELNSELAKHGLRPRST